MASLSGISLDWYTWLEQARDVQPSRATIAGVANALRLEPLETRYVMELAGYAYTPDVLPEKFIEPSLDSIMNELDSCPCVVVGRRWDILRWNRAAELIYGDLGSYPDFERNGLVQYFIGTTFPKILDDRARRAIKAVAIFRMERLRYLADPFFDQLTNGLSEKSGEFAELWDGHEVHACDPDQAIFDHPELGRLEFEHSAYDLNDSLHRGFRMVTYVPIEGTATREKVESYVDSQNLQLAAQTLGRRQHG